jgi:hypothetical protein
MPLAIKQAENIHSAQVMVLWAREFDLQYVVWEALLKVLKIVIWVWQPRACEL